MATADFINKITLGDSYELIKQLDDNSVDAIYTDIPYLFESGTTNSSDLGVRKQRQQKELNYIRQGIDYSILDEFMRVMKKPNIFIWCSKKQVPDILDYFIKKDCLFEILVWCKTNPIPTGCQTWLPDIEYCLYFRESGVRLNDGYELKSRWYVSDINKRDKDKFMHPTIKPLDLVERHIKHTTQEGDIILDAFMGSGTTAVACKSTGRNFIGFEIEKQWWEIANDRINGVDAYGQQSFILY